MPSGAILASTATGPRHQARPLTNQDVGLLVMDSSLNPISWNDETIRILSYPDAPEHIRQFVARPFQQRDSESNEHQSQHREHLFPVDHDQNACFQPFWDTRKNDHSSFSSASI